MGDFRTGGFLGDPGVNHRDLGGERLLMLL